MSDTYKDISDLALRGLRAELQSQLRTIDAEIQARWDAYQADCAKRRAECERDIASVPKPTEPDAGRPLEVRPQTRSILNWLDRDMRIGMPSSQELRRDLGSYSFVGGGAAEGAPGTAMTQGVASGVVGRSCIG